MDKNKVIVNINGSEYIIKGEESQEEMLKVAMYVDKKIKELSVANNKLNPTFSAVLSALNIANELFKARKENEELKDSSLDPIKQLSELKIEYNSIVEENTSLKEQVGMYTSDIEKYSSEYKNMKEHYETLNNNYANKSEELSKAYREHELMRREKDNKHKELERVKIELSESKYKLIDLQNQLLQNQIEIVKLKKELDEYKLSYSQPKEA